MNTAANEWAAKVAARNEVETARAEARRPDMRLALSAQPTFDWTGGSDNHGIHGIHGKEVAE